MGKQYQLGGCGFKSAMLNQVNARCEGKQLAEESYGALDEKHLKGVHDPGRAGELTAWDSPVRIAPTTPVKPQPNLSAVLPPGVTRLE